MYKGVMGHSIADIAQTGDDDTLTSVLDKQSLSKTEVSVVKAEFIAMRLAAKVGLNVAHVSLTKASHKDVLLIEWFEAAEKFLLSRKEAVAIIENQISGIIQYWPSVCDEAALSETDRMLFWRRQFLNPYALEGVEGKIKIGIV